MALPYSYDPTTGNSNGRTIQGFSTGADTRMRKFGQSTNDYYVDFQKFFDYYGTFDYADVWISAALAGEDANFPGKGDAAFSRYGIAGRVGM